MKRALFGCLAALALVACKGPTRLAVEIAGSDPKAPLVVGLHGRGGNAVKFAHVFDNASLDEDVVSLRGPLDWKSGFEWFDWPSGIDEAELAHRIDAAVEGVWPEIARRAHGRKVIVTGFSQGAMLAYAIAARHPDEVLYAVPMSGWLPKAFAITKSAPVHALHGTDDQTITIDLARATIERLRAAGATAELTEEPGVAHEIDESFVTALLARLRAPR